MPVAIVESVSVDGDVVLPDKPAFSLQTDAPAKPGPKRPSEPGTRQIKALGDPLAPSRELIDNEGGYEQNGQRDQQHVDVSPHPIGHQKPIDGPPVVPLHPDLRVPEPLDHAEEMAG